MNDKQLALWKKINAFALDEPGASLPFSTRLARENGWSLRYAHRVIGEYKRFVFLMATSATPVCPSEEVDEAWHLHLCYTRSYWEGLCRGVVGRSIHHEPTQGGGEQLAHHYAMYERTLAAYRATFEREPPADIWPVARERFAPQAIERVDRARNWVLPKPRLREWLPRWVRERNAASTLGGVTLWPLLAAGLWVFDFHGPTFLAFYVAMLLAAIAMGMLIRKQRRVPDDGTTPQLSLYELAVLQGGEQMATRLALTKLVLDGKAEVDGKQLRSVIDPPLRVEGGVDGQFEHAVHAIVKRHSTGKWTDVRKSIEGTAAKIAADLQDRELLETPESFSAARIQPLLMVGVVVAIGVIKLLVGINRGKPVEFLLVLLIASLFVLGAFFRRPPRTRKGERVLGELRGARESLRNEATLWQATPDVQLLGMALFGIGALSTQKGRLKDFYGWIGPPSSSGGCAGVGTGCGGSGCGGGGCGGGGCGGGGCGGCGGD